MASGHLIDFHLNDYQLTCNLLFHIQLVYKWLVCEYKMFLTEIIIVDCFNCLFFQGVVELGVGDFKVEFRHRMGTSKTSRLEGAMLLSANVF
jgi:hypothetical protein